MANFSGRRSSVMRYDEISGQASEAAQPDQGRRLFDPREDFGLLPR
jgi:hypothetical protein